MSNIKGFDIFPGEPITINEASAATGIPVSKIGSLIREAILPKSVCLKIGNRRAVRAIAVPMLGFIVSGGLNLSRAAHLSAMRQIGNYAKENWNRIREIPERLEHHRFETGCVLVAPGKPASEAMAGLNRLMEARSLVVENQDIRGGIPVIRGTRIGVYEAAGYLASNGMEIALEDYPALRQKDLEAAEIYAKAYPMTEAGSGAKRNGPREIPGRRLISETVVKLSLPA